MIAVTSSMGGMEDQIWVALGPSVSSWKTGLTELLGPGFAVRDVLGEERPPLGLPLVTILGTPELPPYEVVTVRGASGGAVILTGTGDADAPRRVVEAVLAASARLAHIAPGITSIDDGVERMGDSHILR